MTKHVIDHPKPNEETGTAREYARIEADKMPRPQTKTLQRRSRKPADGKRLKAFTDIERSE